MKAESKPHLNLASSSFVGFLGFCFGCLDLYEIMSVTCKNYNNNYIIIIKKSDDFDSQNSLVPGCCDKWIEGEAENGLKERKRAAAAQGRENKKFESMKSQS